jgi:hypothetical protein
MELSGEDEGHAFFVTFGIGQLVVQVFMRTKRSTTETFPTARTSGYFAGSDFAGGQTRALETVGPELPNQREVNLTVEIASLSCRRLRENPPFPAGFQMGGEGLEPPTLSV